MLSETEGTATEMPFQPTASGRLITCDTSRLVTGAVQLFTDPIVERLQKLRGVSPSKGHRRIRTCVGAVREFLGKNILSFFPQNNERVSGITERQRTPGWPG